MKFSTASAIEQVVWSMKIADVPRGTNRALINNLFNGFSPYTSQEQAENKIQTNAQDYHGYATRDYLQVEPALGGAAAWRELVAVAGRLGIRLVLDFVANHVSDRHAAFVAARQSADSPTRSWFRFRVWPDEYDCFFVQPGQPELDAEQPAVRDHLLAAAIHWLHQGCDGFRLDYAHGLSRSFWSRFRAATRSAAPESVCFGEITHTPQVVRYYAGRLDGCLDFAVCELLRETFGRDQPVCISGR